MKLAAFIAALLLLPPPLGWAQTLSAPRLHQTLQGAPIHCPYGTGYVNTEGDGDACQFADYGDMFWLPGVSAAGQYQTCASYAIASGVPANFYKHPGPWNYVACDFPIGPHNTPDKPLVDVAVAAASTPGYGWGQLPPGCTYASGTSPTLTCGGGGTSQWGVGHTCTIHVIVQNVDLAWVEGPPCMELQGIDLSGLSLPPGSPYAHVGARFVPASQGVAAGTYAYIHDLYGAVTSNSTNCGMNCGPQGTRTQMIYSELNLTAPRVFSHILLDGGNFPGSTRCWNATTSAQGPCTMAPVNGIGDANGVVGDRYIQFTAIINTTGRPVTSSVMQPSQIFDDYDFTNCPVCMVESGFGDHGEFDEQVVGPRTVVNLSHDSFNVMVSPAWAPNNASTALIYVASGVGKGQTFTKTVVDNNVLISNLSNLTNCQVQFYGTVSAGALGTVNVVTAGGSPTTVNIGAGATGSNCISFGYQLFGPGTTPNNNISSYGTALSTVSVSPPLTGPVSTPTLFTAQFGYNLSAMVVIGNAAYGTFIAHNNYMYLPGAAACFQDSNPNGFYVSGTGSIASGVLTFASNPSGNVEVGQEIYVGGVDTGAHITSETSSLIWNISSSTVSAPTGSTINAALNTLQAADFGSGDPAQGGNGNVNLATGELISGFYGNSYSGIVPGVGNSVGCTGAIP